MDPQRVPDPTPEEIRERCLEIQREWTPLERFRRSGYREVGRVLETHAEPDHSQPFTIPMARLGGVP